MMDPVSDLALSGTRSGGRVFNMGLPLSLWRLWEAHAERLGMPMTYLVRGAIVSDLIDRGQLSRGRLELGWTIPLVDLDPVVIDPCSLSWRTFRLTPQLLELIKADAATRNQPTSGWLTDLTLRRYGSKVRSVEDSRIVA